MTNKKSKKVLAATALALVGVLGVSYVGASVATGSWNPGKWFDTEQVSPIETPPGGLILGEGEGNGISLMTTLISTEEYEEYGISEQADSAYLITATVNSEASDVTDFTFSCTWKNASSSWASGKSVSDYFTITQSTTNKLQATATCLKAFGEPVTISCSYDFDRSIKATAQADYLKPLTNVTVSGFDAADFRLTMSDAIWMTITATPTYGTGTITGTFEGVNKTSELSDSAFNYLKASKYYNAWRHYDNSAVLQQSPDLIPYGDEVFSSFARMFYTYTKEEGLKYINAAFTTLAQETTNQLRCAVQYNYTYGSYSKTGTAYTEYGSMDATKLGSSLLEVSNVSLDGDLVFLPD